MCRRNPLQHFAGLLLRHAVVELGGVGTLLTCIICQYIVEIGVVNSLPQALIVVNHFVMR